MNTVKLSKTVAYFGIFLAGLNAVASFLSWYQLIPWFDSLMHFLGGVWVAYLVTWLYVIFTKGQRDVNKAKFLILFLVFIVAFGWEVYEYIAQDFLGIGNALATFDDSVVDMIFGMIGGAFIVFTKKNQV